jgi:hypothetical protein
MSELYRYDPNSITTMNSFSNCLFNMIDQSVYASPGSRFRSLDTDHSNAQQVLN